MDEKAAYWNILPGRVVKTSLLGYLRGTETQIWFICLGQGVRTPFLCESTVLWFLLLEKDILYIKEVKERGSLHAQAKPSIASEKSFSREPRHKKEGWEIFTKGKADAGEIKDFA